jgi:hypothetical protein
MAIGVKGMGSCTVSWAMRTASSARALSSSSFVMASSSQTVGWAWVGGRLESTAADRALGLLARHVQAHGHLALGLGDLGDVAAVGLGRVAAGAHGLHVGPVVVEIGAQPEADGVVVAHAGADQVDRHPAAAAAHAELLGVDPRLAGQRHRAAFRSGLQRPWHAPSPSIASVL